MPSVAGNGVILYGVETAPKCLIAGGAEAVMLSKDDLDTCINPYTGGCWATGYFFSFASKNDSTHVIIYNNSCENLITYTSDNFAKVHTLDSEKSSNIPGALTQSCFSTKFIYSTMQDYRDTVGSGYHDTLIIIRSTVLPITNKTYQITQYVKSSNLYFTIDSIGYMICSYRNNSAKSVLARTADSGKTWSDCFLDSVNVITACCFPSADTGYITENNGSIYKTIDAGATWFKLSSPTTLPLRCVQFTTNLLGYIGGDKGALYSTANGGLSWNTEISADPNSIIALYTFGKVAYFKDANNSLYKNESPMNVENIQTNGLNTIAYPNPSNKGVFTFEVNSEELKMKNIEVYNMIGEKILSQLATYNSPLTINLADQPNGVYFYRLLNKDNELVASGKLMLAK